MSETPLRGRVAIVAGGGGGIGSAVVRALADAGVSIVVNDLSTECGGVASQAADRVVDEVVASGGTAISDATSIVDRQSCRALVRSAIDTFGRLDIVVNAAGINIHSALQSCSEDDWDDVIRVHWLGHVNLFAAAVPHMAEIGYGRLVAFTSGAGTLRATASNASYGTAKRAVAALCWSWSRSLPTGVTLAAISPVAFTRMTQASLRDRPRSTPGALQRAQFAPATDIAPVVVGLCGDQAPHANGQVVFADGEEISLIVPPRTIGVLYLDEDQGIRTIASEFGASAAENRPVGGGNPRRIVAAPDDDMTALADPPSVSGAPAASGDRRLAVIIGPADDARLAELREAMTQTWSEVRMLGLESAPPAATFGEADERYGRIAEPGAAPDLVLLAPVGLAKRQGVPGIADEWAGHVLDTLRTYASWMRAVLRHSGTGSTLVTAYPLATRTEVPSYVTGSALAQLARIVDVGAEGGLQSFSLAVGHVGTASRLLARACTDLAGLAAQSPLAGHEFVIDGAALSLQSRPALGIRSSMTGSSWTTSLVEQNLTLLASRCTN